MSIYINIKLFDFSYTTKWQKCHKEMTKKHCNAQGVEYLNWVSQPFLESLDLACNPQWKIGSAQCTKALGVLPKTNATRQLPKSILLPLYELFTSFLGSGQLKDLSEWSHSN